jgi:hypothetical protein
MNYPTGPAQPPVPPAPDVPPADVPPADVPAQPPAVPGPGSIRFHAVKDNFGADVIRTVLVVGEDLLGHALGLVLGHVGDAVPFVPGDLLNAPPAPPAESQP